MKNYIVSEEELKRLIALSRLHKTMKDKKIWDNLAMNDDELINDLFGNKQPVELLAEGEVIFDDEDDELWIGEGETWLHGEFKNLEGQNIKIFIQKDTKWEKYYLKFTIGYLI